MNYGTVGTPITEPHAKAEIPSLGWGASTQRKLTSSARA